MPRKKRITRLNTKKVSIKDRFLFIGKTRKNIYPKIKSFIKKRPLASFFVALFILFVLILLNSLLTPKAEVIETVNVPKQVDVVNIGGAARATFSGKVEKDGVVKIVAQTPGIVSSVNVYEGQEVWRGNILVNLANNYQGGNALSVSRQLASLQYQNVKDTYDIQKDLLGKQKELANKGDENQDELRDITDKSLEETRNIISLNDQIISSLQTNLDQALTGGNQQEILTARQLLVQARSGNSQINQALRGAEYQANGDNPPAALSNLGKDIALKQLELQEKALDLSKEASRLQLVLAQISEATMYPASPFNGVVERVYVSVGDSVSPGTPLAVVKSNSTDGTIVVKVPLDTAVKISRFEEATLEIKGKKYNVLPSYISTEATDGQLASVMFSIPDEALDKVSDGEYVKVNLPIGLPDTINTIPFLPIDIVYQTQDGSYVYVIENGKAVARQINLGDVVGGNVAVLSGLKDQDRVILERNIIAGEKVEVTP